MNKSFDPTDYVFSRLEDGVLHLTLNQPQKYNALSQEMMSALQAQFDQAAQNDAVRCMVLGATGKAFCAGHDLKQMRANPEKAYYQTLFKQCSKLMQSIINSPVPVIARVQGLATAAGCQLVATCDLAVADSEARFAVSGINVGLFCSTPAVALSRNVNNKNAMQMLMTGDFIDAPTAQEWGLINQHISKEELDNAISKLTASICAKSAVAVRTGKQLFYKQKELPLDKAYELAGEQMACNMMADDAGEGIDAFIEKRHPIWTDS